MAIDPTITIDSSLAYDIGSFNGAEIDSIVSMGFIDEIFCFEPQPHYFSQLQARKHLQGLDGTNGKPLVSIFNLAFSNGTSQKTLVKYTKFPYIATLESSWLNLERNSTLIVEKHPSGPMHKTDFLNTENLVVNAITLDDFIEGNRRIPAYITMDVQGHELAVLNGLNYKPGTIRFPWLPERYSENVACLERLVELGFTIFTLDTNQGVPEILNFNSCCQKLKYYEENDPDKTISGTITCD